MKRVADKKLRELFPQLGRSVRKRKLTYLDSAATTLKPQPVIDAMNWYYSHEVANIHRAAHFLGALGTTHFESVRDKIKDFLNAENREEVVFTKGTTEGLNLVAHSVSSKLLKRGDVILLSEMEHHSNIVPWQLVAEKQGLVIKVVRVTDQGEIDREDFHKKLDASVKVVSFTHLSNALGTVNPIKELFLEAQKNGALTVLDAAQSASLGLVDVRNLHCDFAVFSGHKLFGPTGVGVLWGRKDLLNELPPYQGGGSMIDRVTFEKTTFLQTPHRFEAGTPPIAEVIGLGAAIDFAKDLNHAGILEHERALCAQLIEGLQAVGGIRLIGNSSTRANIVSFVMDGTHPSDVGQIMDELGVAVRTGHHCCQPLMERMGVTGTVRVSLAAYSNSEDVEAALAAIKKARGMLI